MNCIPQSKFSLLFLCAILILGISACTLAPKYSQPEQDLPTQWAIPEKWSTMDTGAEPMYTDWWKRFQDPVLNALIEQALTHNQDLQSSLANIEASAAQMGIATANIMPLIGGAAEYTSQGASDEIANQGSFHRRGLSRSWLNAQIAAKATWEIDFFGKFRSYRTMQGDVLMATVLGHEATRLAVSAGTANAYFSMLAMDSQCRTAERTLKSREEAFAIYTSRYQQGDITELDWQRASAEVETARAQYHTSTIAVEQAEAALAVLVGRSPKQIIEENMPRGLRIEQLPTPPVIPAGLPSDLLLRRPDVRSAEFLIMAYNAGIGYARAQFFPAISLTGMLGTVSSETYKLFTGPAGAWSYGISATMPLLDFGRIWYGVKSAEAQKQAAIATYRKSVQDAFKDVRVALTTQQEVIAIVETLQRQVGSLRRAVNIAKIQYDNGYTNYLAVLDAERQLFSAELQYATALRDRLSSVVAVCMALGGGWNDPEATPGIYGGTDDLLKAQRGANLTPEDKFPPLEPSTKTEDEKADLSADPLKQAEEAAIDRGAVAGHGQNRARTLDANRQNPVSNPVKRDAKMPSAEDEDNYIP